MDIFTELFNERWVYLIILTPMLLFGLNGLNNEFLYFFFFADKPKSFQKKYKRSHNFLYRHYCLFVFNSEYMKISRFYKNIVRYYIAYLLQILMITLLFILAIFTKPIEQIKVDIFGILFVALIILNIIYFMWLVTHSKKERNFYWYIPSTWHRCKFYIDLPDCNEKGHLKKTGKNK